MSADRDVEEPLLHPVRDKIEVENTLGVLLCGSYDCVRIMLSELADGCDIPLGEPMMVAVCNVTDDFVVNAKMFDQRSVVGDAGKEK